MKTILLTLILLTGAAHAAPVFQLTPQAEITGLPGTTTGWGLQVNRDATEWISFIGSQILSEFDPGFGLYTDFIGAPMSPAANNVAPGGGTVLIPFDIATQSGLGSYQISPLANAGDFNTGTLLILFERYSDNPAICGTGCLLGSDFEALDFTVRASEVPEPATAGLVAAACLALTGLARRSARRV